MRDSCNLDDVVGDVLIEKGTFDKDLKEAKK